VSAHYDIHGWYSDNSVFLENGENPGVYLGPAVQSRPGVY